MGSYTVGSLQHRMTLDPQYRDAETVVRTLERKFNVTKSEVEQLEKVVLSLRDTAQTADLSQRQLWNLARAERELGQKRIDLADTRELLESAWKSRDALLAGEAKK